MRGSAGGQPPRRTGGVVEDGVSGLLCSLGDTDEMASRAVALLKDKKAYSAMAKAARSRAVERFDRQRGVSDYERAYSELMNG